ncbi:unnamed protein product, partial [Meganyctiphanes norvegica]
KEVHHTNQTILKINGLNSFTKYTVRVWACHKIEQVCPDGRINSSCSLCSQYERWDPQTLYDDILLRNFSVQDSIRPDGNSQKLSSSQFGNTRSLIGNGAHIKENTHSLNVSWLGPPHLDNYTSPLVYNLHYNCLDGKNPKEKKKCIKHKKSTKDGYHEVSLEKSFCTGTYFISINAKTQAGNGKKFSKNFD